MHYECCGFILRGVFVFIEIGFTVKGGTLLLTGALNVRKLITVAKATPS